MVLIEISMHGLDLLAQGIRQAAGRVAGAEHSGGRVARRHGASKGRRHCGMEREQIRYGSATGSATRGGEGR
jgi:hypothetical protein